MEKLTTDQLMKKYSQGGTSSAPSATPTSTPEPTGNLTSEQLRTKYSVPATATAPTPEKKDGVKGGFLGELFTGNTQRFGKTIGESLAAGKNADMYSDALMQHTEISNNLKLAIAKKKKEGGDTSRLEEALASHDAATPTVEQFTGDVINKKPGQVLGEAAGFGLELLSGGALGKGASTVASKAPLLSKIKTGAKIGATYGGIGGVSSGLQEDGSVGTGLKEGLKGAAIGGGLGGVLGGAGGLLAKRGGTLAEKNINKIENTTGQILQGAPEDIAVGRKVLSKVDPKKIKTYEELSDSLSGKVEELTKNQDTLLGTNLSKTKLNKLEGSVKVGDSTIKHNYVKDAISQLEDYYQKTNNQVGQFEMAQLRKKASSEGLTVNEINALARKHGKDLNGFNANGELASGLTKQSAENTRKGVKSTVREMFGGKESEAIDKEITDTIRVRDLVQKQTEAVNKLKQKIQQRGVGERVGRALFKVINTLGLGSPKGMIEAAIGRGTGLKTLNAIDLESKLAKNLKLLQTLNDKNIPEHTILEILADFMNQKPQNLLDKIKK